MTNAVDTLIFLSLGQQFIMPIAKSRRMTGLLVLSSCTVYGVARAEPGSGDCILGYFAEAEQEA